MATATKPPGSMRPPDAMGATLVFPAVNQAAADYLAAARQRGERTVCAASLPSDAVDPEGDEVHRLPSIYDQDFEPRFLSLVTQYSIRRVFCPVASVHAFMRRLIDQQQLGLAMVGQSPIRQQVEQHRRLMARAERLLPLVRLCADGAGGLSLIEVAGVLRQASLIYGESNDDKLAAMMGIFARAPTGDVLEIGSLMGRSAFVLLYLAWRYRIGPLLTVDPWMSDNAVQRQSPQSFQTLVEEWDFDVLREGFLVNMVALRADDHNHLQLSSQQAFERYAAGQAGRCEATAKVSYSGRIAVIHIDGNHDYEFVRNDCRLWLGRTQPGSWLILDDYVWAHGDGPYRVGNEFLLEQADRVETAFVCGKALFVRLRD